MASSWEEQLEYTPGGFSWAIGFEGREYSSCNLCFVFVFFFPLFPPPSIFSWSILIYFANYELAKNFLNLGALCFLNKMHLGISRKNVPSNRENGEKHFPVFTLVVKFVFKLGQYLEIIFKKKIRTFKSKPEFTRILEQLFYSGIL